MSGVVLLFMAFAGRSPVFVLLVAFLGFFLFAIRAVLQAWLLDATPAHMAGTSIGIMFGAQAAGAALGRPLRHHRDVLFPGRHHRGRQHVHFLHARDQGAGRIGGRVTFTGRSRSVV
jgi:hypothetical protein